MIVFRQNTGRGRCRCDLVSAFGLVLGNYQFIRSRRGRSAVVALPGEIVLALTDRVVVARFGDCPNEGFITRFVGIDGVITTGAKREPSARDSLL